MVANDFDDLRDTVALLKESLDQLNTKHIQNARRRIHGSRLGSVLVQFPNGEMVLNDAQVALAKANHSINVLESVDQKLTAFSKMIARMPAIASAFSSDVKTLADTLKALNREYVEEVAQSVADDFVLKADSTQVAEPLNAWLCKLSQGFMDCLKLVLNKDTDKIALAEWCRTHAAVLDPPQKCVVEIVHARQLMQRGEALYENVCAAQDIAEFLYNVSTFLYDEKPVDAVTLGVIKECLSSC